MRNTKAADIRIQRLLRANLTYSALPSNFSYSVGSSAASNVPAPSNRRDAGSIDLIVMDCFLLFGHLPQAFRVPNPRLAL